MQMLLDTHAFLWFIMGDSRISDTARELIQNDSNQPHVSMVSVWEMAIKNSIGKLDLGKPLEQLIPLELAQRGFIVLPISMSHCMAVARLPLHHRDPFDRLLVAQCLVEDIPLVSTDSQLDAYGVQRVW